MRESTLHPTAPGRSRRSAGHKPARNPPREPTDFVAMPQGPLVFRSGRPFGAAGESAFAPGLGWPLPGSIAGSVRNHLCAALGYVPSTQDSAMHGLWVHGPLRCTWDDKGDGIASAVSLWLPPPANARVRSGRIGAASAVRLAPCTVPAGCGTDLPSSLRPLWPADGDWTNLEPPAPGDWRLPAVVSWLMHGAGLPQPHDHLGPCGQDHRVHIALDDTRQVKDGHLFTNETLDFSTAPGSPPMRQQGLWMRVSRPVTPRQGADFEPALQALGEGGWRLGADGATAGWQTVDSGPALQSLRTLAAALAAQTGRLTGRVIALYLATPACFGRNGWYPDGFRPEAAGRSARLVGCPPGFPAGWQFVVEGAAVPAWQAQGSFKHADRTGQARPGSLIRLVPAGSMYWLRVTREGNPVDWGALMLAPCCRVDHGRDGHGLALYALQPQP